MYRSFQIQSIRISPHGSRHIKLMSPELDITCILDSVASQCPKYDQPVSTGCIKGSVQGALTFLRSQQENNQPDVLSTDGMK